MLYTKDPTVSLEISEPFARYSPYYVKNDKGRYEVRFVSKSVSLSLVTRPLRPRGLTVDARESVDSPANKNKLIFHGVTSHAFKNVEKVKNFSCERPTFFNIHLYNILNLKSSQKSKKWRISPVEGPKFRFTHFSGYAHYLYSSLFITH